MEQIVDGLRDLNRQIIDRGTVTTTALVGAMLNLHSCRIYLGPEQLNRLWRTHVQARPGDDPKDLPHGCLDIRFRSHLGNYWLYATLSLWTHEPASRAHTPHPKSPTDRARRPIDLVERRGQLLALRDKFADRLDEDFQPLAPTVFNRRYRPPRFWIAVGSGMPEPTKTKTKLDELGMALLGAPISSRDVDRGVITGRPGQPPGGPESGPVPLHVMRRFAAGSVSAPGYLLLPSVPVGTTDLAAPEDAVRAFVQRINRNEARAAAELFDISSDLDMKRSLARSYEWVGERLSVLWDELSMFLPTARGAELNALHGFAELIHQVLLQGVADLDIVVADVQKLKGRIPELAARSVERFDDEGFLEQRTDSAGSIRESIQRGGYFRLTGKEAAEGCEFSMQVRDSYSSMLAAIAHAFDERRVRVTDRLGEFALYLGFLLTGFGLITETWGALLNDMKYGPPDHLVLFVAALVIYATVAGGVLYWMFRRLGVLRVHAEFTAEYQELKKFLLSCRTDHLEELYRRWRDEVRAMPADVRSPQLWQGYFAKWKEVDGLLSEEYADRLDKLRLLYPEPPPDPGVEKQLQPPLDLNVLRRHVEKWALIALLVSERPRSFYGFPLPRLTLLYRFYPIEALGGDHRDDGPELVADSDLRLVLRGHWHAKPSDIGRIRAFGEGWTAQVKTEGLTASSMLKEIDKFGVDPGMAHEDAQNRIEDALPPIRPTPPWP